jgi:hypothetical protein
MVDTERQHRALGDALVVAAPEDLFYLTGLRNMDIFRFRVLSR